MRFIASLGIVFLAAFILTALLRGLALRRAWLDQPNHRSSHRLPTPRSGGLGFVIVVSLWWLWLVWHALPGAESLPVLALTLPMALLGLVDDFRNLSVTLRLSVQTLLCLALILALGGLPPLPLAGRVFDPGALGLPLGVIALLWLVNLYNFMDGIDGIASLEAVFVSVAAALLLFWQGGPASLMLACLGLAAAVSGFLLHNLPPARIFMGDAGSCFLGFALGALALLSMKEGSLHLWSWAILLGVFIVDASQTLLRRMWRGENWTQAHRSHAYQRAAAQYGHGKVDWGIILLNFFWLFPLACFSLAFAGWAPLLTVLAYIPLIFLGIFYNSEARPAAREQGFIGVEDADDSGCRRP